MTSPFAAVAAFLLLLSTPAMAAEMVMFEQPGCFWCKRFNEPSETLTWVRWNTSHAASA